MSIKTRKHAKKSNAFAEMQKYHLGKITLDVENNFIVIEGRKDSREIFLIEPNPDQESKSNFSSGLRSKKGEQPYFTTRDEIIRVPFSEVLKSINLKPFLALLSEMTGE